MLNRIYIESNEGFDKETAFLRKIILEKSGTDIPLVKVRRIVELKGDDVDDTVVEGLKELLVSKLSESASVRRSPISTSMSVMQRAGRSDAFTEEIKSVVALMYPEKSIGVNTGKEYIFSKQLTGREYSVFSSFVKNPLSQVTPGEKEKEHEPIPEAQISEGFNKASYTELAEFKKSLRLKMDIDDLMCVQNYILSESREPTYAEIKIIDNFFSESFRNTTCNTILDGVSILDPNVKEAWEHYKSSSNEKHSISDIFKVSKQGVSSENVIDIGDERCIKLKCDGEKELVLMLGSESRNHSVSAVPYDGAAECLGNAALSMLERLGYVYDSYRVTGGSDKNAACDRELSFEGYAENASEMSVPCKCTRIMNDFYAEKQLEICAVLGIADGEAISELLKRTPQNGDQVFIIGGKTGKDGPQCFDEINTSDEGHPENEKGEFVPVSSAGVLGALRRLLFRDDVSALVKSIRAVGNDGISCAIGDMANGVNIYCNAVPLKYDDVFVSDVILSSSQDRMVVCVSSDDAERFASICAEENVVCAKIAEITDNDRLNVYSDDKNKAASITSEFIISGGSEKHLGASVEKAPELPASRSLDVAKAPFDGMSSLKKLFSKGIKYDFAGAVAVVLDELRTVGELSGMSFDETAGGNSVLEPFSNRVSDASVRYLSYKGEKVYSDGKPLCSAIALGLSPVISDIDPYKGAYLSVTEAVMRLVSSGFGDKESYTALFEYLPEHKNNGKRLGVAVSATLGAFEAQNKLGTISLGGRISMADAGKEYEDCSTISAFAVSTGHSDTVITRDFKKSGDRVVLMRPEYEKSNGLPETESQLEVIKSFNALANGGKVLAACSITSETTAAGVIKMCRASGMGFEFASECDIDVIFGKCYGAIAFEISDDAELPKGAILLGKVKADKSLSYREDTVTIEPETADKANEISENAESEKRYIYLKKISDSYGKADTVSGDKVNAVIPVTSIGADVFDIKAKFIEAGATCETVAFSEKDISAFTCAIDRADILYLPDSFNSGMLMKAVLMRPEVREKMLALRERGGLIYGVGTSFEALLASGMLDVDTEKLEIGTNPLPWLKNASVDIEISSVMSPFMRSVRAGDRCRSVVRGKRLRLFGDADYVTELAKNGRVASQFAEGDNVAEGLCSLDAVTSADGHVMAQISRPDRVGSIVGVRALDIIRSAIGYFKVDEK